MCITSFARLNLKSRRLQDRMWFHESQEYHSTIITNVMHSSYPNTPTPSNEGTVYSSIPEKWRCGQGVGISNVRQDQEFNTSWLANLLQIWFLSYTSLTRLRFCCQTTKAICICTCYAVSGLALLLLCCRIKLGIVEVYWMLHSSLLQHTNSIQRFFTGLIPRFETSQTNDRSLHRLEC